MSLFSGGGLGDFGYRLSGFKFRVFADIDSRRLELCKKNHPDSEVIAGDLRVTWPDVIREYHRHAGRSRPALLTGMPPCEAMSWANSWVNPGRRNGYSRDKRNTLALVITRTVASLKPRAVVMENVVGILSTRVRDPELGKTDTVAQLVVDRLPDYECWPAVIQFADYGIPQRRLRTILTFIRRDDPAHRRLERDGTSPLPVATHGRLGEGGLSPWVTARQFLGPPWFRELDASSEERARDPDDPLHCVPVYGAERYELIRRIPRFSGLSAYDTDTCPSCGALHLPRTDAKCWRCGSSLWTRPIVIGPRGGARLIVGSDTAYSRIPPDLPVATVTTASGHLGSDVKIHPWENRVLSVRECADAQTIPRTFQWPTPGRRGNTHWCRSAIGDAIPPWFTYLHGRVLRELLDG